MVEAHLKVLFQKGDVDAAVAWVESLPPDTSQDSLKRDAFRAALRRVTYLDADRGREWYLANENEPQGRFAETVLVQEWVESDPEAALDWLLARPAGDPRDRAVRAAMTRFVESDLPGLQTWMTENGTRPGVESGIDIFVKALVAHEPLLAIQWAEAIPNERQKAALMTGAIRRWARDNPEAAAQWLETADLPDLTREMLAKGDMPLETGSSIQGEGQ